MKLRFDATELAHFREIVTQCLGLQFEDTKSNELNAALISRIKASACPDTESYIRILTASFDEQRALAGLLTVPETYFFRMIDHFRALKEVVIPDFLQAGCHEFRFLSAGCASGEEAYSMAMLANSMPELEAKWVKILGVDINSAVIEKAKNGRYSDWSLRETPSEMREKHFRRHGRHFQLNENILKMVSFEEGNLANPAAGFWRRNSYEVVFIRNVLMYFSPASTRNVIERVTDSLAPGGYLFMGSAENLRGLSQEFHLCQSHGVFYYQRKKPGSNKHSAVVASPGLQPPPASESVPELEGDWLEAIRLSTKKVEDLTRGSQQSETLQHASSVPPPVRLPDMNAAMDLLRRERFAEALDELSAGDNNVEAQLLRAVVLTNSGRLPEAEACCETLLKHDELNAGAHYVMALCREHAQDWLGARTHDQAAMYLDPSFAMPHLHLGLLARRTSDLETARRELAQAVLLLEREDGSRILLFGGGFSRESLVQLCRRELETCGGKL